MRIVISPEKAIANGISPQELNIVAEWHEDHAAVIHAALGSKKKRAFGCAARPLDRFRHEQIAVELRAVSATVVHLSKMRAAA